MKGKASFAERVDRLWAHRYRNEIESCYQELSALKLALGLGLGRPEPEKVGAWIRGSSCVKTAFDVLLLHASLARVEAQYNDSRLLFLAFRDFLEAEQLAPSPYFLIEAGVQFFVRGDNGPALEYFIAAASVARTPVTVFLAKWNVVLCSENLNLSCEQHWRGAKLAVRRCPVELFRSWMRHFELRCAFREGELDRFFRLARGHRNSVTHEAFYIGWVEQLPYHRYSELRSSEEPASEPWLTNETYLHLKNFRARTLSGLHQNDAGRIAKPSDLVDRIYLWLWRSLCGDGIISSQKLASAITAIDFKRSRDLMTFEDLVILQNVFLWLRFFCEAEEVALERKRLELACPDNLDGYAVFELERLVVTYLLHCKRRETILANDTQNLMQQHPLWKTDALHFLRIVAAVQARNSRLAPSALQGFVTLALEMIERGSTRIHGRLRVDLRGYRIESGATVTHSEPLCRAFFLLRHVSCVPADTFLREAFGLARYDCVIHDPKILNLLARMKRLAPRGLFFRMKRGFVLAEGDWQDVEFLQSSTWYESLRSEQAWRRFFQGESKPPSSRKSGTSLDPHRRLLAVFGTRRFSRNDAQKILEIPRSTANRVLAAMVRERKMQALERGKNRIYFLKGPFNAQ